MEEDEELKEEEKDEIPDSSQNGVIDLTSNNPINWMKREYLAATHYRQNKNFHSTPLI